MNLAQLQMRARLAIHAEVSPSIRVPASHKWKGGFVISKPSKNDVLLGRGKPRQNWAGNQFMLALCDTYRERYHSVERIEKNQIIDEVKSIIKSKGGRFLEVIESGRVTYWVEVSDRISYRKVGHAFRSNSRRLTAEKNAEIAIVEEAARTGKSYEDVLKKKQEVEGRSTPALAEFATKPTASANQERCTPIAEGSIKLPSSLSLAMPSNTSPPELSSTEKILAIEARRKQALADQQQLIREEAIMKSGALGYGSMGSFGPPLLMRGLSVYDTRIDSARLAAFAQIRLQDQLEQSLINRNVALASDLANPFFAGHRLALDPRFGGTYGWDAALARGGLPGSASIPLVSAPSAMMITSELQRLSPTTSALGRRLPTLQEGRGFDHLIHRVRSTKPSSIPTGMSAVMSLSKNREAEE